MTLDRMKRLLGRPEEAPPPPPEPTPDGLVVDDHELKLTYRAKTSQGVRLTAGPNALASLPNLLADVAHRGRVTVVPPLDSSAGARETSAMAAKPARPIQRVAG